MPTADSAVVSQKISAVTAAGAIKAAQASHALSSQARVRSRRRAELPPLIIRDVQQLRTLGESKAFRSRQPLVLDLPEFSGPQAFAAAERLSALRRECGCSLGAKFLSIGFVLSAVWLLRNYGLSIAALWRAPIALLAAICFAGLGKAIGLALARRNFHREIKLLVFQISEKRKD
jgi:hypothetical protein